MGYIPPTLEEWKNPELMLRKTQRIQAATQALWLVAIVGGIIIAAFLLKV